MVKDGVSVPKVRFKNFLGGWQLKQLKKHIQKLDAGVSVNSNDNAIVSNYWILKTSCLTNGIFNSNERKAVTEDIEIARLKEPLLNNSIVMSRMNTPNLVGVISYIKIAPVNTFLPDRLWQLKSLDQSVHMAWLTCLLSTQKNLLLRQSKATGTSGSMKNISKGEVLKQEFYFPNLNEQTQIGDFFQKIDQVISLQQKALEAAQNYKKAMLQKMFPPKGEEVPQMRFRKCDGSWNSSQFGKVIKTYAFKNYLSEASLTGRYPVIQQGDNSIAGYSNTKAFMNYSNVILFGDHTLSLYKPACPFLIATDGVKILSFEGFDNYFAYILLEKYKPSSEGYKRHFSILKEQIINFPDFPEQQKIGSFFQKLDQQIGQHEKKLANYQSLKKAMLQRMFV